MAEQLTPLAVLNRLVVQPSDMLTAVPPFVLSLGWHERWHHDPGHAWLRDRLVTSFLAGAGAGRGRSGG